MSHQRLKNAGAEDHQADRFTVVTNSFTCSFSRFACNFRLASSSIATPLPVKRPQAQEQRRGRHPATPAEIHTQALA